MIEPFFSDEHITVYNMHCREIIQKTPDESVDLIASDVPYGIDFQSNQRVATKKMDKIEGDTEPPVYILKEMYRVLKANTACYIFTRWDVMELWRQELEKAEFEVKHLLVWDKGIHGMGDLHGDWGDATELILYATKGRHILNIPPRPISPIRVQKVAPGDLIHPNEKPVGVWYPLIKASSQPGDLVLDPYCGSCSSLLACRQLNRRAVGCEIDPQWLQKAEPRLNQMSLL